MGNPGNAMTVAMGWIAFKNDGAYNSADAKTGVVTAINIDPDADYHNSRAPSLGDRVVVDESRVKLTHDDETMIAPEAAILANEGPAE